jgi:dTDP-glucose 4,6-dehydratase
MAGDGIVVTGGAGFIGSNFVQHWLAGEASSVVCLDKLTYAGNLDNLSAFTGDARFAFVQGDICDSDRVLGLLLEHRPGAVVHFAAESHVDRSILGPAEFVRTNVNGTFALLDASRAYLSELSVRERDAFRFLHVSTDEVFGSLSETEPAFTEASAHRPNSPYAASKAAADHLVRAYRHTYGLATLTVNCSNNYGPYQFPEKLIPLVILNALEGKRLPVYGDGLNVRDWLYVQDHCAAIARVLGAGQPGETYNIGGDAERTNLQVVGAICDLVDELTGPLRSGPRRELLQFVSDRPGHDRRYAMDSSKIRRELGWTPKESFESGLRKTVSWYLANTSWVDNVRSGAYRQWLSLNYDARGAA